MATYLDIDNKQGEKSINAKKVRNLSATKRKVKAYEQKERIEDLYSMRIDRATSQRESRRAKRRK